MRPIDPLMRDAVHASDLGDDSGLRAILHRHPELSVGRVEPMDETPPPYFERPTLLHFIADNPTRVGNRPANIRDIAAIILDAGADVDAGCGHDGSSTTLGLVVSSESCRLSGIGLELCDLLLERGARIGGSAQTALMNGQEDAARHLLRRGALLDLPLAAGLGEGEAVRRLLPGASAPERHKALMAAAYRGQSDSVAALIAAGTDPNGYAAPGFHAHSTALHQAVSANCLACVQLLVEAGAALIARDKVHGATPLDWAEHLGQAEIADFLRSCPS
jgi:peptide-methionine (S)-S-oxide reductase